MIQTTNVFLRRWVIRQSITLAVFVCTAVGFGHAYAQSGVSQSTIVARVDDDTITVYELVFAMWNQRMLGQKRFKAPEKLRTVLEELIFEALLRQEALSMDLSEDWTYRTRERVATTLMASRIYQDEELLPNVTIDSAAVDSYYNANIELFTVPRQQRHLRQITVYKENFGVPEGYWEPVDTLYVGWDPKRKVDSLYERLRQGEEFTSLAALYSEEPRARSAHGDWGWISREGLSDTAFARMVFDRPLHRISQPIELPFAWVIVQVLGEREPGTTQYNENVVTEIRRRMLKELGLGLAVGLVDSLLKVADVRIIDENLALPDTNIDMGMPLAIVNEKDTIRGSDFFHIKNSKSDYRNHLVLPEETRRSIIRHIMKSVVLRGALREWGYLDRPEVLRAQQRERVKRVKDVIKAGLSQKLEPDSADVKRYYKEHIREFTQERRHFIHSRRFTDADSAAAIADIWKSGAPPQGVHSQWIKAGDVPNPVWNRVASIAEGSVVGPVGVNGEYWVVLLERIAGPQALREVYSRITGRLRNEEIVRRRDQWVRSTSRHHDVIRRLSVLEQIELPTRQEASEVWFPNVVEMLNKGQ